MERRWVCRVQRKRLAIPQLSLVKQARGPQRVAVHGQGRRQVPITPGHRRALARRFPIETHT